MLGEHRCDGDALFSQEAAAVVGPVYRTDDCVDTCSALTQCCDGGHDRTSGGDHILHQHNSSPADFASLRQAGMIQNEMQPWKREENRALARMYGLPE